MLTFNEVGGGEFRSGIVSAGIVSESHYKKVKVATRFLCLSNTNNAATDDDFRLQYKLDI